MSNTHPEPVVAGDPSDATVDTLDHGRILACEFFGTAVLILGGPGTAILAFDEVGVLGVAAAFGLSLAIMAYVIGPVSGCHINPAVTLGMLLARKVSMTQAVYSWIGQVVGGIFGALVIFGIASGRDGWERGNFASNGWDRNGFSGLGASIIVEIVFTALLVAVVLATTTRNFAPGFGGLIAGGTLFLIHLATIPVDNTGVNPARSLATALFADTDPSALSQLWAFILFPLVGSVVGVFVWLLVDEAALEDTMFDHDALRTIRDKADDALD
jgi:aquaporin Z